MTDTYRYDNSAIDRIFGVFLEVQSYKNIGYLLLSFPLGLLYFLILIPGISLSISLAVVVIGFPLLLAILLLSEHLLGFERFLLKSILHTSVVVRSPEVPGAGGIFRRLGERIVQGRTWKGLFYLLLRFVMGLSSFILVMVLIPLSLTLVAMPFIFGWAPLTVGRVVIDNAELALMCCSAGAILLLLSLHVINAWTGLWKRIAVPLLS